MTNNSSYYHDLNGSYVVVNTRSSTFIGKLEADSHETLVLRPSVIHEPRIFLSSAGMQNQAHYRLESNLPTIINTMEVQSVQPTTEVHIREIVNYDMGISKTKFKKNGARS